MNLRLSWLAVATLSVGLLALISYQVTLVAEISKSIEKPVYFVVKVQNEEFIVAITDKKAIADAMDSMVGRKQMFPMGDVAFGDGGFNIGYKWHLIPETVRMVEVAIELCDGLPSHVEKDPQGWINSVKQFCPWTGRVVRRLDNPNQYALRVKERLLLPATEKVEPSVTAQSLGKAAAVATKIEGISTFGVQDVDGWLASYINNNSALIKADQLRNDQRLEKLDMQTRGDFINEWGALMFSKVVPSRDLLLEEAGYLDGERKELHKEQFRLRDVEWNISSRRAILENLIKEHNDKVTINDKEFYENQQQIAKHNKEVETHNGEVATNDASIEEHNREVENYNSECLGRELPPDEYNRCLSWQNTLNQRVNQLNQRKNYLDQRGAELNQRSAELNRRKEEIGRKGAELNKKAEELNKEWDILLSDIKKYEEALKKVKDWEKTLGDQIKFFVENKVTAWVASLESFNARLEKVLEKV